MGKSSERSSKKSESGSRESGSRESGSKERKEKDRESGSSKDRKEKDKDRESGSKDRRERDPGSKESSRKERPEVTREHSSRDSRREKERKKTLLLVFVHGFQGDDDTFGEFPEHIKAITKHTIPSISIRTKVFPCYETRGELALAVLKLRDWLQDTVIEMETKKGTQHLMIEPTVKTVLVCHSMGGIVAADALLSIIDEPSVSGSAGRVMFPYIQGILAFDTPYLGLATGMFAHTANTNIKTASAAINGAASLASSLFATKKATDDVNNTPLLTRSDSGRSLTGSAAKQPRAISASNIPPEGASAAAAASSSTNSDAPTNTSPAWQRWGKLAMFAGAASALAAGGAAAYLKREEISQGFGWASSHLEFVSELIKGDTLRRRLTRASTIKGVGFANFYTSLGERDTSISIPNANEATANFLRKERTFCSEPDKGTEYSRFFVKCVNPKALDEVGAHTGMFSPKTNPGYYEMSNKARDLIVSWAEDM
ncbi:hypothetical protein DFH27DRAFT_6773 [Peziza echinospora]|nr:hypothetical protein DFH27DRAFT_6773 [Peziza echinospora]